MSIKATVLQRLYNAGKITDDGLKKAVSDGVITHEEYLQIIGEN